MPHVQLPGSSSHIGTATLREDGTIAGIASPNETFWLIDHRQKGSRANL